MMQYHLNKRKPIAGQSAMGFLLLRLATAAGGKTSVVKTGIPKLLPVPIPVSCAAANQVRSLTVSFADTVKSALQQPERESSRIRVDAEK
ncbi:MAG: hypothetical protein VB100_08545 [Angelakisella sp.]|nr:hypothetical protein [Angelakisella sp.]